jgi:hypothetical protein
MSFSPGGGGMRLCDLCAMPRCIATSLSEMAYHFERGRESAGGREENQTRQRLKVADKFSKER